MKKKARNKSQTAKNLTPGFLQVSHPSSTTSKMAAAGESTQRQTHNQILKNPFKQTNIALHKYKNIESEEYGSKKFSNANTPKISHHSSSQPNSPRNLK